MRSAFSLLLSPIHTPKPTLCLYSTPQSLPLFLPSAHRFPRKPLNPFNSARFLSPRPPRPQSRPPLSSASQKPSSASPSDGFDAARNAVARVLQEYGVPPPAASDVASNCPKYLEMLMDSVRDLDELNLWSSWRTDGGGEGGESLKPGGDGSLCFESKVYYMAKEKGDKGLLPYLESIGLSLSSASRIARYLESETLPALIHKVNYVKEMFFSGSDDEGRTGINARRMMMHLSIPIDEDVQQTLSFFEKIEARRGGLNMLGSKEAAFRYLVESFPRLLLLPLESHMKPMVEFLENIGVSRRCMRNILLLFPPIIFYDIKKGIKPRLLAFEKIGMTDEEFGRMLIKYPWIISARVQENYEEIYTFFDVEKVPKLYVNRAIKNWPLLMGSSTSKLKLMVEQFSDLGIRNKKLGQVIATSPQLLLRKPHEFLQVVSFLEDLGFDRESIGRILGRCPEIFCSSIEKTLKKKLEFLTCIGVSKDHLPQVIRRYPELFVSDVDRTLFPRMKYLLKTGLSKRDIAFMIRGFSPLLGYSVDEVLRPKLEFLVNTMEKPVKAVVEYPRYFSYSLEKKIMPRFWMVKAWNADCSLKEMLGKNDEEFAAEFMSGGPMLAAPHPSSPPHVQ